MIKRVSIAAAAATLFAGVGWANSEVAPVTAEDFAKFPLISSASMSLEGDMMVAVITEPGSDGKKRAAAYWDLSGDLNPDGLLPPSAVTPTSGRSKFFAASALKQKQSLWFTVQPYVGALQGCGEGKTTGSTKKYLQKAYMGDEMIREIDEMPAGRAEIGASAMLERCFELVGETNLESLLPLDPDNVVISRATTNNGIRYYKHNLRTGDEEFLFKGDDEESFIIGDEDGEIRARVRLDYVDGAWKQFTKLYDPTTDTITEEPALTVDIADRYTQAVQGKEEGTNRYFVATDRFSDKVAIYYYDVVTNEWSDDPVLAHPEFNIGGLIFSQREQDFGQPIGFTYNADVQKTYWIDPEMDSIQKGLESAYQGKHVDLIDYTDDRNRVLFSVEASDMPPAYFLLVDKKRVVAIGSSRPWIDTDALGKTELVYYKARDGMQIPGLLTTPPNYQKGTPARGAIILPHGGPWARDYGYFDTSGWTQYFASRGYVVLQPQYRGSDGWGRELWLAGDAEWGQKMQDDKDDGAAWLVENNYTPADKIAIHGYSYGGFAAFAASVRPNSPYQCAIAGAGVSNLAKLGNEWGSNRIQRIVQGNTVAGMDPMQNTDKINIPIMIYHGDYDVRVPIFHSRDFYNAIKSRMPGSEFIELKEMGHQSNKWLPEHKEKVLKEIERFLNTTCGM